MGPPFPGGPSLAARKRSLAWVAIIAGHWSCGGKVSSETHGGGGGVRHEDRACRRPEELACKRSLHPQRAWGQDHPSRWASSFPVRWASEHRAWVRGWLSASFGVVAGVSASVLGREVGLHNTCMRGVPQTRHAVHSCARVPWQPSLCEWGTVDSLSLCQCGVLLAPVAGVAATCGSTFACGSGYAQSGRTAACAANPCTTAECCTGLCARMCAPNGVGSTIKPQKPTANPPRGFSFFLRCVMSGETPLHVPGK